jgi:hypothetical protein
MVSGSTSLFRLHDRSRIPQVAARGCANIIGFAPRKSTVALPRLDEQGADPTMKPIVAGKPAAQSRTHPDAGRVCSAVFF